MAEGAKEAIGAMKRELGGTKKMIKAVAFQTIFAWIFATIVYQVGSRILSGAINIANVVVIGIILLIVFIIVIKNMKASECSGCPYCDNCKK